MREPSSATRSAARSLCTSFSTADSTPTRSFWPERAHGSRFWTTCSRWLEGDFDRAVEFLHDPDRLFHDPDDRYVELSKESMYAVGQRVTSRDFHSCHTFDVRDQLSDIAAPTLAIVGEHDMLTPPWYHEFLAENVRDGEYAEIDDAAHLAMLETPDAFNEALVEFLAERR